jgi:hypothetical protein
VEDGRGSPGRGGWLDGSGVRDGRERGRAGEWRDGHLPAGGVRGAGMRWRGAAGGPRG